MNSIARFNAFCQETWKELKRTAWPSAQEVYGTTLVVVVVTGIIALYLGVVDLVLAKLQEIVLLTG